VKRLRHRGGRGCAGNIHLVCIGQLSKKLEAKNERKDNERFYERESDDHTGLNTAGQFRLSRHSIHNAVCGQTLANARAKYGQPDGQTYCESYTP